MADPVSRGAARTATLVALPAALVVGALVFWLLGGFGGGRGASPTPTPQPSSTVRVDSSPLDGDAATVCRGFIAQLPGKIRNLHRRPVSDGVEQNAAFGQPPLLVHCGGPAASFPPTATVYGLAGVCFYADRQAHRSVWTTVDRRVPVTVTVPGSYSSPGQWVAEFSDSIAGSVRSADRIPTGCGA
ncbi:MAG: DUF3515 family protein [Actinocatenispora sp.]